MPPTADNPQPICAPRLVPTHVKRSGTGNTKALISTQDTFENSAKAEEQAGTDVLIQKWFDWQRSIYGKLIEKCIRVYVLLSGKFRANDRKREEF